MKIYFLKAAVFSSVILTSPSFAGVWHALEIENNSPEPMGEVQIQEDQDKKIINRKDIKIDDFIQNTRTQEDIKKITTPSKFKASISTSTLTAGQAKESLYLPGDNSNISLLTWNIRNSPIIKTDLTWSIFPWLAFNINGWTTLNSNKSEMNDYDWLDPNDRSNNTEWSQHTNTKLNYANHLDLNAQAWFIDKSNYKLGAMAGYQVERFSWTAKGGTLHYSQKDAEGNYIPGTSQQDIGIVPDNLTGLGYTQKFKTPYIGLIGEYQHGNFELTGSVKMSKWSRVTTTDHHYLRNMTSNSQSGYGDYFSASLNAGYYLFPYTKFYTEIGWTEYKRNLGKFTVKDDNGTQTVNKSIEQDGASNKYLNLGLGIQHQF